jgi:hypothetical protein
VPLTPKKYARAAIKCILFVAAFASTVSAPNAATNPQPLLGGSSTQTLNETQLKGNVTFDSALKISAQIPDTKGGQTLKSQINALVDQSGGTGLEYLNQLAANPNIQWDKVALANEKWSYDQAGLTPAGAALSSIAVAVATSGMGSGAASTLGMGTTTTVAGVSTFTASAAGLAMNAAASAAISSLASQAAVAMVNNKGDIGKTLEQLGKEEGIKNLLTTMVTAGALDKLNASYFKGIDAKSSFIDQLQKNLTNNIATDLMNSALAGKPFDETTFANSLKGALINTGTAQGANAIGDGLVNNNLNEFTHKLAHAVLGCAGAAASGAQCSAGAVGAVVGELTAEYAKASGMSDDKALSLARVLAATSGVITGGGGDNAAAVNIAAMLGENAAQNNYLNHAEILRKKALQEGIAACAGDSRCAAPLQTELNKINKDDQDRDRALAAACNGSNTSLCTLEQQKVRSFAADVILKGDKDVLLGGDGKHTLAQAVGTFDKGRLLVQTARGTVVSVLDGYLESLKTALEIVQDPVGSAKKLGAQAQQAAQDAKEALEWIANNPVKYKEIAQAAERQLRSDLASAVQSGDEAAVGAMLGGVLANFSPDPLKKVNALNKVIDEVKLAKKAEAAKVAEAKSLTGGLRSPLEARQDLEAVFGEANVTSTTIAKNPIQRVNSDASKGIEVISNSSGKAVSISYKDPVTGNSVKANIPYDGRGLPIFDDVSKYTTKIDASVPYEQQFKQATLELKKSIESGKVNPTQFTAAQLKDIQVGAKTIEGYTWHHNAQSSPNNMQLVPQAVHDRVRHMGQGALSQGK